MVGEGLSIPPVFSFGRISRHSAVNLGGERVNQGRNGIVSFNRLTAISSLLPFFRSAGFVFFSPILFFNNQRSRKKIPSPSNFSFFPRLVGASKSINQQENQPIRRGFFPRVGKKKTIRKILQSDFSSRPVQKLQKIGNKRSIRFFSPVKKSTTAGMK